MVRHMTQYARVSAAAVLVVVACAAARAQDIVSAGAAAPPSHAQPGWTFIPTVGFTEMYDDNVALFGFENNGNDYVASVYPGLAIDFSGKHTEFTAGYSGSYLDYHTFQALNRWDQGGSIDFKRQENARFQWFGRGTMSALPSTDLVDFAGVPYRRVGVDTTVVRTGFEYRLTGRQSIAETYEFQKASFADTGEPSSIIPGGHVHDTLTAYRWRQTGRLAIGADYIFRYSTVLNVDEHFTIHEAQGVIEYELSPSWKLSGGAGVARLMSNVFTEGASGPAWRLTAERRGEHATVRVSYVRTFLPSFGFGTTMDDQLVEASLHLPLTRHVYTDHVGTFRDDQPVVALPDQLAMRSFHTTSVLGWAPQPWVRIEAFYVRSQQTSFRPGGDVSRDRIGFQIVTSKPMRVQ